MARIFSSFSRQVKPTEQTANSNALASLGEVILAFSAHSFEQLFLKFLAFRTVDFDVLAPLRHVVLVVSGLSYDPIKIIGSKQEMRSITSFQQFRTNCIYYGSAKNVPYDEPCEA